MSARTRHLFKYASGTETRSSGQQLLCTAWEVQKLLLGPMWGSEFASETFTQLQIAQYLKREDKKSKAEGVSAAPFFFSFLNRKLRHRVAGFYCFGEVDRFHGKRPYSDSLKASSPRTPE